MSELVLQDLLKAGVHFGHQTRRWNPKMKKYVYGEANGIYIIDLAKTIVLAKKAYNFLQKTSAGGRPILFVGVKRQACDVVKKAAESCGAFYVTHRWLGGMLTNYKTINLSIDKLRKVERMKEAGDFEFLTKKERYKIEKDILKLERNLGGIRDMRKLPGAVFVIDSNDGRITIKEANKLGIPVVAVTDTNCNPDGIDYVVPGNDDAIKSIQIFADYFAGAVASGSNQSQRSSDDIRNIELETEIISKYEQDIDLREENTLPQATLPQAEQEGKEEQSEQEDKNLTKT